MRAALALALTLLALPACQTNNDGAALSSDESGWFNIRTNRGNMGLYYCNAKDIAVPKCYRASVYDDSFFGAPPKK